MKSFLKKIAREFPENFVGFLCKFPVNSRAIFLRNDFTIVRLPHFRNTIPRLVGPSRPSTQALDYADYIPRPSRPSSPTGPSTPSMTADRSDHPDEIVPGSYT